MSLSAVQGPERACMSTYSAHGVLGPRSPELLLLRNPIRACSSEVRLWACAQSTAMQCCGECLVSWTHHRSTACYEGLHCDGPAACATLPCRQRQHCSGPAVGSPADRGRRQRLAGAGCGQPEAPVPAGAPASLPQKVLPARADAEGAPGPWAPLAGACLSTTSFPLPCCLAAWQLHAAHRRQAHLFAGHSNVAAEDVGACREGGRAGIPLCMCVRVCVCSCVCMRICVRVCAQCQLAHRHACKCRLCAASYRTATRALCQMQLQRPARFPPPLVPPLKARPH